MLIKTNIVILLTSILFTQPSFSQQKINEKDAEKLVFSYCYALQASALCDGLQVRLDTEEKIENIVGGKFRGPQGSHNETCLEAVTKANDDEDKGVCRIAWDKYGCFGNDTPKLIQQSAFTIENAATCPF